MRYSKFNEIQCYFLSFSCMMWASYGILKDDATIVPVNLTGMLLQVIYILCFFFYCKHKVCAFIYEHLIQHTTIRQTPTQWTPRNTIHRTTVHQSPHHTPYNNTSNTNTANTKEHHIPYNSTSITTPCTVQQYIKHQYSEPQGTPYSIQQYIKHQYNEHQGTPYSILLTIGSWLHAGDC